jgi:hypothetical protein
VDCRCFVGSSQRGVPVRNFELAVALELQLLLAPLQRKSRRRK